LGTRFKQVFGQAAPQEAKYKYTTSEGISQELFIMRVVSTRVVRVR
jgi:hypothetical protein